MDGLRGAPSGRGTPVGDAEGAIAYLLVLAVIVAAFLVVAFLVL